MPTAVTVPAESKWKTDTAVPFTRETFLSLLDGTVPVIKVPSYVSKELSGRIVQHLLPSFTPYLHATGPSVEKVGLAQFEFQAQSAEDFKNRTGDGENCLFLARAHLAAGVV